MSQQLYFGVTYCPYAKSGDVDMEYWERDILTMKKLNINIMRPFVAWDRVEIEEGVYDYSKLDHIFALADKHGMKILLNLGGVLTNYAGLYPPRWLICDYDIQQIVNEPGLTRSQFGPGRSLCPDDPVYLEKAMDFLKNVILRYRDTDTLTGWNLWNEPFHRGDGCFCPLTLKKFRQWLNKKYHTLESLNTAWGSECPVLYRSWDDVEPGGKASFNSGYVPRMDWIRFNRARVAEWLDNVRILVEEHDTKQRPVTTNVVLTAAFPTAGQHSYPSLFEQNREQDVPGYSAYTFFGQMQEAGWPNAAALSWVRSSGVDFDRGFWAIETEAGQMSYFPDKHARAEKGWRIASNWQLVLHGARMVMLWKFGGRNTDTQTDSFNLTGWDGSITERARLQGDFAETFLRNEALFKDKVHIAETAILVPSASEIAAIADGTYKQFAEALHRAYNIMHDLRIPCDFIDDGWIKNGRLDKYKVLLMPGATLMDAELAAYLERFVETGGCLIADRFCAMKNDRTEHFQTSPGFGLQKVFGAYMNDANFTEYDEKLTITDMPETYCVSDLLHSHLHLSGAESVAEYSFGGCAVSRNHHGKGNAWLWGIEPFHCYGAETKIICGQEQKIQKDSVPARDALIRTLMQQALREAGVESDYLIEGDESFSIEAGALCDKEGSKVHFLINFADSPIKFKLKIRSGCCFKDLLSNSNYRGTPTEFELPAYGTLILCPEYLRN
jgi:beta-galactosidase